MFGVVEPRCRALAGLDNRVCGAHLCHRFGHRGEVSGSDCSEHGRSEEHSLGLFWEHDFSSGDVRVLSQKDRILGAATGGEDGLDLVPAPGHGIQDVAGAVGHRLDCSQVEHSEVLDAVAEPQTGDHPARADWLWGSGCRGNPAAHAALW